MADGISAPQAALLKVLLEDEGVSMRGAAEQLGVTRQANEDRAHGLRRLGLLTTRKPEGWHLGTRGEMRGWWKKEGRLPFQVSASPVHRLWDSPSRLVVARWAITVLVGYELHSWVRAWGAAWMPRVSHTAVLKRLDGSAVERAVGVQELPLFAVDVTLAVANLLESEAVLPAWMVPGEDVEA